VVREHSPATYSDDTVNYSSHPHPWLRFLDQALTKEFSQVKQIAMCKHRIKCEDLLTVDPG